jgi:hypothetical protein
MHLPAGTSSVRRKRAGEALDLQLRVRAEPGVDVIRSLRAWLKFGLRTFGLRCVSIEELKQKDDIMDMKKYTSGLILPDDVRNGPRQERIINVYISEKFDRPVLVFESGDEFIIWPNNGRVMARAYGYDSKDWIGHVVELSLGSYVDKKDGQTKDTVDLKPITPRDGASNNGGPQRTDPAKLAKDLNDEIPFN